MATNITRSCFVLATKNTTTPFLYHTRTLTSFSSSLNNHSISRYSRSFSTQNSSNEDGTGVVQPSIESQINSEDSVHPSNPIEEAPKPRRSFLQKRAASVSAKRSVDPKPIAPTKPSKKITPKITPYEKQVFGGLLEKIGVKHDGVSAEMDTKSKPLSPEKQAEMTELMAMFGDLLQDPQKKRAAKKALKKQQYEIRVAKRKAAEKAEKAEKAKGETPATPSGPRRIKLSELGYSEPASSTADEVTISVQSAVQMVVDRESEHIEFALFQAVEQGKGDMGVWEVCKERVFSMLLHLDDETFAQASNVNLDTMEEPQTSTPRPSGPLRIPPVVPTAPVLAALYPKILLIAFQHGRLSALLGASSGLYDELITYQWRVCRDLPAVIGILREMDQLGVNPSNKSRGLLTSLIIRQGRDLKAFEESSDGQEFFWNFPSNRDAFDELTRKDGWMDKIIAASNQEKWQLQTDRSFPR
ncbi:unnamed protein product [Penicillium salamii]|nr:unnamed protein product [Penicillium salamii]